MAIDPRLGYDPANNSPAGAGIQTIEQWAAAKAAEYTVSYANGNPLNPPEAFTNDYWATLGLPPLPPESAGATRANPNNTINPGVYSGLHMFFMQIASHPQNAASSGIVVPQLPSGGPVLSPTDQQNIFNATQGDLNRQNSIDQINAQNSGAMARDAANNAFAAGENAANRAQQMAIANLQEAGMNARNAADIAARMSIAQLQEAGESARNAARIAADLQMNTLNNETQRYGIDTNATVAREDLAGRERIATADRTSRETIAGADRAESARQFDLNIGEDRRQFNATMLFDLFEMGVNLVKNPVDWIAYQHYLENLSIPMTVLNAGTVATSMGAVPQSGPSELGPIVGGPGAIDGDFEAAQSVGATPGFMALSQALQQNPGTPDSSFAGTTAGEMSAQWGDITKIDQMLTQSRAQAAAETMDPSNPLAVQAREQMFQLGPQSTTNAATSQVNTLPSLGAQPQTTNSIYSGSAESGVAQNQPMEQLIRDLAGQLGMNEADLWKMSGAGNLTPAYSKDAIANAPVMQALRNGAQSMSQFRSAPVGATSTASPSAQLTGPGLGLRGGQDVNAGLLINNTAGNKGLIQGAVMADGHDWDTFAQQALKASPITQYDTGVFGRRR